MNHQTAKYRDFVLLALFAAFTLAPPDLPLFTDPNSGVRGIFRV